MKVIMLVGDHDRGKTTTMRLVYNDLRGAKDENVISYRELKDPRDFETVLKFGGKTVAIYSMGDYSNYTTKAIRHSDSMGYDILICTSNRGFKRPFNLVKKYPHEIIDKSVEADRRNKEKCAVKNRFDADKIIALL